MLKELGAAFNQPEGRHSRLERADGRLVDGRRRRRPGGAQTMPQARREQAFPPD